MSAKRGGKRSAARAGASKQNKLDADGCVEIPERKISGIYEALDSNNNKQALRIAGQLLEKIAAKQQPPRVVALRALALARLGRADEATQQLDGLVQLAPVDEATLNVIHAVARNLGEQAKFAACMANVCAKRPGDVDLLAARFSAVASTFDWKQAQLAAMQLHKLAPANVQFLFWYAVTIYMQATGAASSSAGVSAQGLLMLGLAERMLAPLVAETATTTITKQQELLFYLRLLRLQGKWTACLDVVDRLGGALLQPTDRLLTVRAELLAARGEPGDVERAIADYTTLIEAFSPDDWRTYTLLFDQIERLAEPETRARHVAASRDVLLGLVAKNGRKLRGPHLGLIEHGRRFGFVADDASDPFVALLLRYGDTFGDKAVCLRDTLLFFAALSDAQRQQWRAGIAERQRALLERALVGIDGGGERQLIDQLSHELTVLKTAVVLLPADDDDSDALAELARLVGRYLPLYDLNFRVAKGDRHPADDFVLLLATTLHEQFRRQRRLPALLLAVELLEHTLRVSPYNFQFRLLLIHLYGYVAALEPARRHYAELHVKSVQLDTLSHLVADHAVRQGGPRQAHQLLADVLHYHDRTGREVGELLVEPLRKASYCKVDEVIEFRRRLRQSVTLAAARVESAFVDMALTSASPGVQSRPPFSYVARPALAPADADDVLSNQDDSIYDAWTPGAKPFTPCESAGAFATAMADVRPLARKKDLLSARQRLWRCLVACQTKDTATLCTLLDTHSQQSSSSSSSSTASSSSSSDTHSSGTQKDDWSSVLNSCLRAAALLGRANDSGDGDEARSLCRQADELCTASGQRLTRLLVELCERCAAMSDGADYDLFAAAELLDSCSFFAITFLPAVTAVAAAWNELLPGLPKQAPSTKELRSATRTWLVDLLTKECPDLIEALGRLGSAIRCDGAARLAAKFQAAERELFTLGRPQSAELQVELAESIVGSHAQSVAELAKLLRSLVDASRKTHKITN